MNLPKEEEQHCSIESHSAAKVEMPQAEDDSSAELSQEEDYQEYTDIEAQQLIMEHQEEQADLQRKLLIVQEETKLVCLQPLSSTTHSREPLSTGMAKKRCTRLCDTSKLFFEYQ